MNKFFLLSSALIVSCKDEESVPVSASEPEARINVEYKSELIENEKKGLGYFRIDNQSTTDIYDAYLKKHGKKKWGNDLFDGVYLPAGSVQDISVSTCNIKWDYKLASL